MTLKTNFTAAWLCLLPGMLVLLLCLARSLARQNRLRLPAAAALLLPAALGLALSKAGYLLLQLEEDISIFHWCYTTGLLGMAAGVALAARLSGAKPAETLDHCAAALCIAMAFARLAQRWLGDTGIGPFQDQPNLFSILNDWEEPVLATWLIEALLCLAAAAVVFLRERRKQPRVPGGSLCLAFFLMMIPQILVEQFRSGAYLSYMMMRLEQVPFALVALAALLYLCAVLRRKREICAPRVVLIVSAYVLLLGFIALLQFVLDGKVFAWPAGLCWALYALAVAAALGLCCAVLHRADRAAGCAPGQGIGKEQIGQ